MSSVVASFPHQGTAGWLRGSLQPASERERSAYWSNFQSSKKLTFWQPVQKFNEREATPEAPRYPQVEQCFSGTGCVLRALFPRRNSGLVLLLRRKALETSLSLIEAASIAFRIFLQWFFPDSFIQDEIKMIMSPRTISILQPLKSYG